MRTVVITGATSGIGLETAKLLAENGFLVLGVGRNTGRCAKAQETVAAVSSEYAPVYFTADLMRLRETERVAEEISGYISANCRGELHALINNAGCARGRYMTTEDGYEQQFALNYLSGFLLSMRLLPLIEKAHGRILITGSRSHLGARIHWDDIMLSARYDPLTAYKQSKLCCILLAKWLNERYSRRGIRAYAVDPGLVRTDIGSKDSGMLVSLIWSLRRLGGVSPEIPARTYLFLCSETEAPDGLYYRLCRSCAYSRQVTNENADRLFTLSGRLCGISTEEREAI